MAQRADEIRRLTRAGKTDKEIGELLGVSDRHVRRLAKADPARAQRFCRDDAVVDQLVGAMADERGTAFMPGSVMLAGELRASGSRVSRPRICASLVRVGVPVVSRAPPLERGTYSVRWLTVACVVLFCIIIVACFFFVFFFCLS